MDEHECVQVFQGLTRILEENGMEWVSQQVSEQIRIGKTIQREIETLKEGKDAPLFSTIDDYSSKLMRGPKATFPVTVEYQPYEQLDLLINAIKQVIVETAEMEQHLISFFEQHDNASKKILFYTDEPGGEPKSISKDEMQRRYQHSKKINELIETLRMEIRK